MSVIRFNPWKSSHKSPFGAIKENELARITIEVFAENIEAVYMLMHKDNEPTQRITMEKRGQENYSYHYFFNHKKGLYFYHFEVHSIVNDQLQVEYYGASEQGGEGRYFSDAEDIWDFQITCYEKAEATPAWYREGIFYQIFPDRFFNGNEDRRINNPKPNTFIYATETDEPLYVKNAAGEIIRWDFYGGNLQGIIKKIPYLKELGVTGLYLNPIFEASSNHRYDTADYFKIDPVLGTQEDFRQLIDTLHDHGMHVILDGVFSHVGQNSRYFNKSGSYGTHSGATRNCRSPYFSWFTFEEYPNEYKSWWGIKDLPEVNKEDPNFQQFIYGETDSVLTKWNSFGVDGWRLDVADELPDEFIAGIRHNLDQFPEKVLLGEVWEDASNKISYNKRRQYILGNHLQGVMNYPLRKGAIALLNGEENPESIARNLMRLYENYPRDIFYNNLNNIGTHDTERILSMLGNHVRKLDLAFGFMFIFPGIPCVYYGDEAGLTGGKDPDNRKFFPWQNINKEIYHNCRKWVDFRKENPLLIEGDLIFFYTDELFGILRSQGSEYVALLINPTNYPQKVDEKLTFFAEETPLIQEIRERVANRVLKENGYMLLTSKQKQTSIEWIKQMQSNKIEE